jgi:hypothetical protein
MESEVSSGLAICIALGTQPSFFMGAAAVFFAGAAAALKVSGCAAVMSSCCARSVTTTGEGEFEIPAAVATLDAGVEEVGVPAISESIGEFAAQTALAPAPACTMKAALKHAVKRRTRADTAEFRTKRLLGS